MRPQPGYRSELLDQGAEHGGHPRPAPLHGPGRLEDVEHGGRRLREAISPNIA